MLTVYTLYGEVLSLDYIGTVVYFAAYTYLCFGKTTKSRTKRKSTHGKATSCSCPEVHDNTERKLLFVLLIFLCDLDFGSVSDEMHREDIFSLIPTWTATSPVLGSSRATEAHSFKATRLAPVWVTPGLLLSQSYSTRLDYGWIVIVGYFDND